MIVVNRRLKNTNILLNTNITINIAHIWCPCPPDLEKGAVTRTLSAEIFENCGNFLTMEDYAPLFSEENVFVVEMFDETFNVWHIYSL